MTSLRPPVTLALLLLLLAPVRAQEEEPGSPDAPTAAPPPADARKLTKAQIQERLDEQKRTLLPKVWPPKCETDEAHRRKYLDKWQAVVSDHYIVFTNGPTASCQKYAVTLEELYRTIQKRLPFPDLDRLLVAYIFA